MEADTVKALLYPFQIDINGNVATTSDYEQICRGQLIDVLMTNRNERIMRPLYGSNMQGALFDPADELVRSDAANQVMQGIQQWAPRVTMQTVVFTSDHNQPGAVFVDVRYKAGPFAEVSQLKMPTLSFIDQESPL
jgi:uncharacterized protein